MKICRLAVTVIVTFILLGMYSGCGGGGGSSTPADIPSDAGGEVDPTDAFVATSSATLAKTISQSVVKALGLDVVASVAAKASPLNDTACEFLNSTSSCADGGTVYVVGYCMPVDNRHNIDLSAIFGDCTVDGVTMNGRLEITAVLSAPTADSVLFDMYILGDHMDELDPGASISDEATGDIYYIVSIEPVVTVSPAAIETELFHGSSIIDGTVRECAYNPANPESFECASIGPPALPEPLCESDEYICEETEAGHEQCHALMADLDIAPLWMHSYQTNCLNGCCDDGLPRDNTCFGSRECATHEDCRFPNFAMACIDGFCQGLCSTKDDLRCRHGAVCDLNTNLDEYYYDYYYSTMYEGVPYYNAYLYDNFGTNRYEDINTSLVTLPDPADYGVCVCPQTDWTEEDIKSCGNGAWDPEDGELCDPSAPAGLDGCAAGLRCYDNGCHKCMEDNCQDGIDNDGNGEIDCLDFECLGTDACVEGWCAEGSTNPCCIHENAWCRDNSQSFDCYVDFDYGAPGCIGPSGTYLSACNDTPLACHNQWCRENPYSPCCTFKYSPLDCLCDDDIDNNSNGLTDCQDIYCDAWAPICGNI